MSTDVVVIGGGLIGSSTALHLAMRGMRVTVVEKSSPGRHASGVNAGGLRRLNRHPAEIPLAVEAAEMWRHIADLVGSDCDVRLSGQVRVAENADDWSKLEQRAALVRSLGFEHEQLIDRDRLYRLVPALAPHCVGALYTEDDGFARPYHALTAFRLKAQHLGVRYRTGCRVTGIDRAGQHWRLRDHARNDRRPDIRELRGRLGRPDLRRTRRAGTADIGCTDDDGDRTLAAISWIPSSAPRRASFRSNRCKTGRC